MFYLPCCLGWTNIPTYQFHQPSQLRRDTTATFRLHNIPPPSESNVIEFIEYASKQSPPASFYELQQDCVRATRLARRDGYNLLEVEYPPLPANVLEMDDVSTYDVLQANIKVVLDYAKGLLATSSDKDSTSEINKIAILLPDQAEADFAIEKIGSNNPYPGIVVTSIREVDPNDLRFIRPEQILLGLFGRGSNGAVKAMEDVDVYICLSSSAQELPDIEELHNLDPSKTIIFGMGSGRITRDRNYRIPVCLPLSLSALMM